MTRNIFKILSFLVIICIFISGIPFSAISAAAETEDDNSYVVWVNGKNIGKEKKFYNYISVPLSELRGTATADIATSTPNTSLSPKLPSGCRYVISVTESTVTSINDAYKKGRGKAMLRQVSANYNSNRDLIKVTAGKKEGKVKVWIAELYEDTKNIIAYANFNVTVKVADKEFTLALDKEKSEGFRVTAENTATANSGTSATIQVSSITENPSADNKYNWRLILPQNCDTDVVTMTVADDTRSCTLKLNSILYYDEITYVRVRCVNEQSRSVATYRVKIQNNITSVTGLDKPINLRSAQNIMRKVTITPTITTCFRDITDNTDKIKAYVITGTSGGYEFSKTGKLIIKKKAKTVSAKVDDAGRVKLVASEGTPDGTAVRVLYVVKHADRTFDVYESAVITIG